MSLRVPSYAQVKAFYALPALLPFTAVTVAGWNWLAERHRVLGVALWNASAVMDVYGLRCVLDSEAGILKSRSPAAFTWLITPGC